MNGHNTLVIEILAKLQAKVTGQLEKGGYSVPTSDTLVLMAKDLGFIEGRRGRAGGFEPTDNGLKFLGKDVEEYRAKEAMNMVNANREKALEARRAREERAEALRQDLEKSLNIANKQGRA